MAAALMVAAGLTVVSAQPKKTGGANSVTYDVTINADGAAHTGRMVLAVNGPKVTGKMHITSPGEITGNAAGSMKAGVMTLDFPYHMVQRNCDGQIAMNIRLTPKLPASNGTVEIVGCGRDASNKLAGTIELKPVAAQKKQ
ncbi:MAG TPA: hypothetical protein VJ813_16820 [Vicinamibacterales bacterium]|nr:hypothetical protein [Vicinamibacterales bacterium]